MTIPQPTGQNSPGGVRNLNLKALAKATFRRFGFDVRLVRNLRNSKQKSQEEIWAQKWRFLQRYDIRTIIDIGANIGQFATMINYACPKAQLYCFEPIRDCFDTLEATVAGIPKAKAFHMALGSEEGQIEMNHSAFSPSSSILTMADLHKREWPKSAQSSPEEVRLAKLDDVLAGEVLTRDVLIKVDVQGYEDHVIRGGRLIMAEAAVVVLETSFCELYHGQPLFDDIYRVMSELGFVYCGNVEQHARACDGRVLQADAIFEKRSMMGS